MSIQWTDFIQQGSLNYLPVKSRYVHPLGLDATLLRLSKLSDPVITNVKSPLSFLKRHTELDLYELILKFMSDVKDIVPSQVYMYEWDDLFNKKTRTLYELGRSSYLPGAVQSHIMALARPETIIGPYQEKLMQDWVSLRKPIPIQETDSDLIFHLRKSVGYPFFRKQTEGVVAEMLRLYNSNIDNINQYVFTPAVRTDYNWKGRLICVPCIFGKVGGAHALARWEPWFKANSEHYPYGVDIEEVERRLFTYRPPYLSKDFKFYDGCLSKRVFKFFYNSGEWRAYDNSILLCAPYVIGRVNWNASGQGPTSIGGTAFHDAASTCVAQSSETDYMYFSDDGVVGMNHGVVKESEIFEENERAGLRLKPEQQLVSNDILIFLRRLVHPESKTSYGIFGRIFFSLAGSIEKKHRFIDEYLQELGLTHFTIEDLLQFSFNQGIDVDNLVSILALRALSIGSNIGETLWSKFIPYFKIITGDISERIMRDACVLIEKGIFDRRDGDFPGSPIDTVRIKRFSKMVYGSF